MAFGLSAGAAALIGGGLAAGGAVISGAMGASAAKSAAKAQANAANSANATQLEMYNQTREDQAPWRTAGTTALNQLTAGTKAGGSLMRNFGASDFQTDPGYGFRLSEGMKGVNNSAAARGGLLSGAALKAASKYNQDFASNEYSNAYNRFNANQTNQFNRLASIAGVGQTANNAVGQAGQNMANNVSQTQLSAGNARASGYVGQANALSGALGQGWNMYQGNQLMNALGNNNWSGPTGGIGGRADEMARLNASIG